MLTKKKKMLTLQEKKQKFISHTNYHPFFLPSSWTCSLCLSKAAAAAKKIIKKKLVSHTRRVNDLWLFIHVARKFGLLLNVLPLTYTFIDLIDLIYCLFPPWENHAQNENKKSFISGQLWSEKLFLCFILFFFWFFFI